MHLLSLELFVFVTLVSLLYNLLLPGLAPLCFNTMWSGSRQKDVQREETVVSPNKYYRLKKV